MDCKGYVTIHGRAHGPFRGNDKDWSDGALLSFSYGVESPRDISSGQASGKRQHQPVVITKEWGASSQQLYQAFVSNEVLTSVVIQIVGLNGNKPKKKSRAIHLSNAVISHMKHIGGGKYMVSFVYEEISFSYDMPGPAGITYHGSPSGPVPMPYPN
jgi:type VI secretion system secreted protein Hcp